MNWRGSGIYATTTTRDVTCDAPAMAVDPDTGDTYETETPCGWEGEVDVNVNDYRDGTWTCPSCGATHDIDRDTLNARDDI